MESLEPRTEVGSCVAERHIFRTTDLTRRMMISESWWILHSDWNSYTHALIGNTTAKTKTTTERLEATTTTIQPTTDSPIPPTPAPKVRPGRPPKAKAAAKTIAKPRAKAAAKSAAKQKAAKKAAAAAAHSASKAAAKSAAGPKKIEPKKIRIQTLPGATFALNAAWTRLGRSTTQARLCRYSWARAL